MENSIVEHAASHLKRNDMDFFKRVWNAPSEQYLNRLNAIDFKNKNCVLDAGFGMGQWTLPYAQLNTELFGIEFSEDRVEAVRKLVESSGLKNMNIQQGDIENLPYEDNKFDAIFCYSVVFLVDYRKALREFYRVLKPGGKVYFTANGLGWYLFCMFENHNKSESYDPRSMGVEAIKNTIQGLAGGGFELGKQIIIDQAALTLELKNIGFADIRIGHEGELVVGQNKKASSFYSNQEYLGQPMVYECISTK